MDPVVNRRVPEVEDKSEWRTDETDWSHNVNPATRDSHPDYRESQQNGTITT